jgi:multisubunit Na+/H+ antiporter MnhG subunit
MPVRKAACVVLSSTVRDFAWIDWFRSGERKLMNLDELACTLVQRLTLPLAADRLAKRKQHRGIEKDSLSLPTASAETSWY